MTDTSPPHEPRPSGLPLTDERRRAGREGRTLQLGWEAYSSIACRDLGPHARRAMKHAFYASADYLLACILDGPDPKDPNQEYGYMAEGLAAEIRTFAQSVGRSGSTTLVGRPPSTTPPE